MHFGIPSGPVAFLILILVNAFFTSVVLIIWQKVYHTIKVSSFVPKHHIKPSRIFLLK